MAFLAICPVLAIALIIKGVLLFSLPQPGLQSVHDRADSEVLNLVLGLLGASGKPQQSKVHQAVVTCVTSTCSVTEHGVV